MVVCVWVRAGPSCDSCDSIHTPEPTELPHVPKGSVLSSCVSAWAGHVTVPSHGHLHPPLHAVCLPASRLHVPSAHSRAALAPPANEGLLVGLLPAARAGLDPVLGALQSHILHGGLCSLPLPNTWWQTSSSPCSTISRSLLQVCNLRKTNKCRAAWLYLSEI